MRQTIAKLDGALQRFEPSRAVWRALALMVLFSLVVVQSWNGRRQLVDSQRTQCVALQRSTVQIANAFRTIDNSGKAIATGPGTRASTRVALGRQSAQMDSTLRSIDAFVDPSTPSFSILNRMGRKIVASYGRYAFSCKRAYPAAAAPWQFWK